jgi:hypothetical protein
MSDNRKLMYLKNALKFFTLGFVFSLAMAGSAQSRIQTSYLFECNEKTSVIGMAESKSDFETNYDTHEGWRSQSIDGSYRVWAVPSGATIRSFDWSCKIRGQDAVIKIWHQSTSKDELIDKYGIQHERCGAFRKLRFTYAGKVILQDILMQSDGCDLTPAPRLKTMYFSQTDILGSDLRRVLGRAFALEGRGISTVGKKLAYRILIDEATTSHIEPYWVHVKSRNLQTKQLPITENVFNNFLTIND